MEMPDVKQEARQLVDSLPDDATWDDLVYTIYVRQAVDSGMQDSDAGRVLNVGEVRAKRAKVSDQGI